LDYISVGSLRVDSSDILVAFLLLIIVLRKVTYSDTYFIDKMKKYHARQEHFRLYTFYLIALALFCWIFIMFASMSGAMNMSSSVKEIAKWIEFGLVAFTGMLYLRTRTQIYILLVCMMLAAISQAILGYTQILFTGGPSSFIRADSLRIYGSFGQPNPFAGYLNIALTIALALAILCHAKRIRLFSIISTILLTPAILLTQSRGGYLAVGVALLFIIFMGFPQWRIYFLALPIIGLVSMTLYLTNTLPPALSQPVLRELGLNGLSFTNPSPQDYSTAERLAHWIAGWHMFLDHPLLGVGIGNYGNAYASYHLTIFVNSLGQAHDYYINVAAETGVLGIFAYVAFLISIYVVGFKVLHLINSRLQQIKTMNSVLSSLQLFHIDRAFVIAILAAWTSVCIHNLVDDLYVHSIPSLLALLISILFFIASQRSYNLSVVTPDSTNQEIPIIQLQMAS
jgi:O-antigen ligase